MMPFLSCLEVLLLGHVIASSADLILVADNVMRVEEKIRSHLALR